MTTILSPYNAKKGRYIKITVADTGMGMDESTRERIFDPFFTTKGMGRGTGLGLATVYGIIKGHNGMIDVQSKLQQGTTFTIHLPASDKPVVTEKAVENKTMPGVETILLVDDEPTVLEVNKTLLEALGYRLYIAGSGQEALAVFMEKNGQIDLVILDMIMPGISGGENVRSPQGCRSRYPGAAVERLQHQRRGPEDTGPGLQRIPAKALSLEGSFPERQRSPAITTDRPDAHMFFINDIRQIQEQHPVLERRTYQKMKKA